MLVFDSLALIIPFDWTDSRARLTDLGLRHIHEKSSIGVTRSGWRWPTR